MGLELHLLRESQTSNVLLLGPCRLGKFEKALAKWTHVGDIQNLGSHDSLKWAYVLHHFAHSILVHMVRENGDAIWGAKLNCQQFARKVLCALGITFNESACGDSLAPLIDCYCTLDTWK